MVDSKVDGLTVEKALRLTGLTRAELARKLGISKQAASKWVDVPAKWVPVIHAMVAGESSVAHQIEVAERSVEDVPSWVKNEPKRKPKKRRFKGYGSGSKYDGVYSRMKIDHIRNLLEERGGDVDAVFNYIQPIQWDKQFIHDVSVNKVEPAHATNQ